MSLKKWFKTDDDNSINHKSIKKICEIFEIDFKDVLSWKKQEKSFENILNLRTSEDSTITHFIVPLLRRFLEFDVKEIDIKPQLHINYGRKVVAKGGQSDIIVRKGKRPVFVIEAKAYGHPLKTKDEDAEGQAWDYTRANELRPTPWYHITTNVCEIHVYDSATRKEILSINEDEFDERLPQLYVLLSKSKVSEPTKRKLHEAQAVFRRPITDDKEFQRILFNCQDILREAEESKIGKEAFDEMNKLLFIKIFEDRRERQGEENRFTSYKIVLEGENYIKGTLFGDIKKFYKKRGTEIFREEDKIELDSSTVNLIVKKLEGLYLVDEDGKVFEPVGNVYENFVGTIFRGENGQYFTPRPVVEFLADMADIKWGEEGMKICDPACGSGGFLLSAFNRLDGELKREYMNIDKFSFKSAKAEESYRKCKERLCIELLVGFDNENSVAKTAMMNMSVHGDGSTGIYFGNSLIKKKTKNILDENGFDAILTNPPFSVNIKVDSYKDIDDTEVLDKYELAHIHKFDIDKNEFIWADGEKGLRNQDSKILFLERCHELIKEKKLVGILIDDGVLNNPTNSYVRDWVYRNFIIKAVVALPFEIFKERGATNRTSVLLLQKKTESMMQGDVFMAIPEHAGESFGKLGQKQHDDLRDVLKDWELFKKGERKFKIGFAVKKDDLENLYDEDDKIYGNRIDPKYYNPEISKILKKIEQSGVAKSIMDVVDFKDEVCEEDNVNSFGSKYIEKITKEGVIKYSVIDGVNDPKGKEDRIFRAGDLVASRINLKSGMIAFVPETIDEIMATSEYYKLVPKEKDGKPEILKEYLWIVLTSKPIQMVMDAISTGQYMRLNEEELSKIKIPVPDQKIQARIIKEYKEEAEKASKLRMESEEKEIELSNRIENMILSGKL